MALVLYIFQQDTHIFRFKGIKDSTSNQMFLSTQHENGFKLLASHYRYNETEWVGFIKSSFCLDQTESLTKN